MDWRYQGDFADNGRIIEVLKKNINYYGLSTVFREEEDSDLKFATGIFILHAVLSKTVFSIINYGPYTPANLLMQFEVIFLNGTKVLEENEMEATSKAEIATNEAMQETGEEVGNETKTESIEREATNLGEAIAVETATEVEISCLKESENKIKRFLGSGEVCGENDLYPRRGQHKVQCKSTGKCYQKSKSGVQPKMDIQKQIHRHPKNMQIQLRMLFEIWKVRSQLELGEGAGSLLKWFQKKKFVRKKRGYSFCQITRLCNLRGGVGIISGIHASNQNRVKVKPRRI
jgi:hypothetical protein